MLDKKARIDAEIGRLKNLFKDADKNIMDVAASLFDNAAFMTITLQDLQGEINAEGVSKEFRYDTRKTPQIGVYNNMIKSHMAVIKQLVDLLQNDKTSKEKEQEKNKPDVDEFTSFMQKSVV
jgi:hypothetical protein